jgi:putative membrane protein
MLDENYQYWGMHLIWWFIWGGFVLWIFFLPYRVPGVKYKKDTPLDILQKRYVNGEISKEEFLEKTAILNI